jgi:hypothetical protein
MSVRAFLNINVSICECYKISVITAIGLYWGCQPQ